MDEAEAIDGPTVGERLRVAREKKKLSLEDIASATRIPRRHLENLEIGDWERLPAPTYTVGFAKSYATAVGLDRTEIGDQLRAEMGGTRPDTTSPVVFQPADPARSMPKSLVLGAIAAVIVLVLLFSWFQNRSVTEPDEAAPVEAQATAPAPQPAAPRPADSNGPVVLSATEPSWIQVTDGGRTLFQGELTPAQPYQVPADAAAPVLRAGKPEALRITVGGAVAPPVGPPGKVAANVSLRGPDLMRPASAAAGSEPGPAPAQ